MIFRTRGPSHFFFAGGRLGSHCLGQVALQRPSGPYMSLAMAILQGSRHCLATLLELSYALPLLSGTGHVEHCCVDVSLWNKNYSRSGWRPNHFRQVYWAAPLLVSWQTARDVTEVWKIFFEQISHACCKPVLDFSATAFARGCQLPITMLAQICAPAWDPSAAWRVGATEYKTKSDQTYDEESHSIPEPNTSCLTCLQECRKLLWHTCVSHQQKVRGGAHCMWIVLSGRAWSWRTNVMISRFDIFDAIADGKEKNWKSTSLLFNLAMRPVTFLAMQVFRLVHAESHQLPRWSLLQTCRLLPTLCTEIAEDRQPLKAPLPHATAVKPTGGRCGLWSAILQSELGMEETELCDAGRECTWSCFIDAWFETKSGSWCSDYF